MLFRILSPQLIQFGLFLVGTKSCNRGLSVYKHANNYHSEDLNSKKVGYSNPRPQMKNSSRLCGFSRFSSIYQSISWYGTLRNLIT